MESICFRGLLTILFLAGCASSEAIRSPQYRLGIPDALALQDMRLAVQNGILAAGWDIGGERGASVLAEVSTDDGWAQVIVEYRRDAYRIRHHRTSPTMNYDQGYVSWRYNKWVLRLDTYLRQAVAQMVSAKNTARVAAPVTAPPHRRPPQEQSPSSPPAHAPPSQVFPSEKSADAAVVQSEAISPDTDSVDERTGDYTSK